MFSFYRLFPVLFKALSPNGLFYLVSISYNNISEIMELLTSFGFTGTVLNRRQIRGELLYVLKFTKMRFESN